MSARDDIRDLLAQITTSGSFATRRLAAPDDLRLSVKGVGRVRLPVTATQALHLCAVSRPARHGYKDETRLDRRVRDTWEVPRSRIAIDQRAWNKTLAPQLDGIRRDLGLPDKVRLRAALHNMLVYEPGQFFVTHQDSEKADGMIGTLVVILPSSFMGGEMVIAHHDEQVTLGAAKSKLAFVAFYADCHHEIRPITRGYRVALTYNLILDGHADGAPAASPRLVDALAQRVRRFFDTPLPQRWMNDTDREPPDRLVYLLDHEYTQRGLGWSLLKNADAARAAALREVARHLDCEIVLALADVHETWSCEDPSVDWSRRYRPRRRWGWHGQDEEDEGAGTPHDALELTELIESDIELRHWVAPGGPTEAIAAHIDRHEVCSTKASSEMKPFQSEHQGYMGNEGMTLDRWYHRAAVVLWPRERTFVIRARASVRWAIDEVAGAIKAGRRDEARRMAERLRPFWARSVQPETGGRLLDRTMRVAAGLDDPTLAAALLQPFTLAQMTSGSAPLAVRLLDAYGLDWCRTWLAQWSSGGRHDAPDVRAKWLASTLPDVCRTLGTGDVSDRIDLARDVVRAQWAWVVKQRKEIERYPAPKESLAALTRLGRPLLGLLQGSLTVSQMDLHTEILAFLASSEYPHAARVHLLRAAHEHVPAGARRRLGLAPLRAQCAQDLAARLSASGRADDDWSILDPVRCTCALCKTLGRFLRAPAEVTLEWPLAKDQREHIHRAIDLLDLPVGHTTRRTGRPFTLVLAKTRALFERDAAERRQWKSDLAWLTKTARAF